LRPQKYAGDSLYGKFLAVVALLYRDISQAGHHEWAPIEMRPRSHK
jgi:hypothetical protein